MSAKKKNIKYAGKEYTVVTHANGAVVIYDEEGDEYCTMPKTPADAIHLRSWSFASGVRLGKKLKMMEIRQAIGAEDAEHAGRADENA